MSDNRDRYQKERFLPAGRTEAAKTAYVIEGLLSALVALALFVLAATGRGRDYSDPLNVRWSEMEIFLPFFLVMLTYASLTVGLAFVQVYIWWPTRLKSVNALSYGAAQLVYVYVQYWIVRRLASGGSFSRWKFLVVLMAGLLLAVALVINAVGVAVQGRRALGRHRDEATATESRSGPMMATKVYVVGGLILVLVALGAGWCAGAVSWLDGRGTSVTSLYAWTVAYPTCVGLGALAIILGVLQMHVMVPKRWHVIVGTAYLTGAGVFSRALYKAAEGNWSVRLSAAATVGVALLAAAVLVNLGEIIAGRMKNGTLGETLPTTTRGG